MKGKKFKVDDCYISIAGIKIASCNSAKMTFEVKKEELVHVCTKTGIECVSRTKENFCQSESICPHARIIRKENL